MYRADTLLSLISSREDLGLDVTLERNVCALLLGKEREAQKQLVMAHGTAGTGVSDGEAGEGAAVARRKGGAAAQQGNGGGRGLKRSGSGGGTGGGGHEQLQLGAVDSAFVVMVRSFGWGGVDGVVVWGGGIGGTARLDRAAAAVAGVAAATNQA